MTEILNVDIVTPASRFMQSKVGITQQTSRRGRGRGRRKTQANLIDLRNTLIMSTEDGTSEDIGTDIGTSVDGILQIMEKGRLFAMLSGLKNVHNERLGKRSLGLLFL